MALGILSLKKMKTVPPPKKTMEVTYQNIVPPKKKEHSVSSPKNFKVVKKEPEIKEKVDIIPDNEKLWPLLQKSIKDISKFSQKFKLEKKSVNRISSLSSRGKIRIPLLKSEKITNVKYLAYIQKIREIIKKRAEDYLDDPDFTEQEVYLTFVLESSGYLKEIKIIEEKTSAQEYLREIGLKCIRESSPFPPFPKDMNYPELSFNIIISIIVQDE